MSGISASLGRTVKTNIVLYSTDNKGRDGYITYNNGGFWKDNIKQIKLKHNFPRHINTTFHSLIHQAAPFNYYSDGRGRDTYVIKNNAGLVREFNSLANRQILAKYLRKDMPFTSENKKRKKRIFLTSADRRNYLKIREIQNNVVRRLYDDCLEKFREKINSISPISKGGIDYNLKTCNNFPYEYNERTLYKPNDNFYFDKNENKVKDMNVSNKKMKRKNIQIKMNKTSNNFYKPKINSQKAFSDQLKLNNGTVSNFNNYLTVSNMIKNKDIKNSFNTASIENWNPITAKYNNTINNYAAKNIQTTCNSNNKFCNKNFRDRELNKSNLSEVEKNMDNNTLKLEVYKLRPKSYRTLFQKTQILNNQKPFLIDDFQEYSECEQ